MKQVLLKPVDTFFFRNHKDFLSGVDSTAGSIFPPRPGTIYGALRSGFIHENGGFESFYSGTDDDLKHWMGTPEEIGQFSLRGVMIHDEKDVYLPLPLDYQVVYEINDNKAEEWAYPLKLINDMIPGSDGYQYRLYGVKEEKSLSAAGAYIAHSDWKKAQLSREPVRIYRKSHWVMEEDKLGIKIDRERGSSEKGMLYNIKMDRFIDNCKAGFIAFSCDGQSPDFQRIKLLRLGGKNRPWSSEKLQEEFELYGENERQQIITRIKQEGIARLLLLSPVILSQDSDIYDHKKRQFRFGKGMVFSVIAQATGRPVLIGGWDIAANRPKDRIHALPAGSVFYLKVEPEKAEELFDWVFDHPISDELNYEGYGWAVCSSCPS